MHVRKGILIRSSDSVESSVNIVKAASHYCSALVLNEKVKTSCRRKDEEGQA